jgi:hypothetical protein
MLDGINFAKYYQKDSYNQTIFIGKNRNDKNILATLKRHSLLKMWNSKTLKIQRMFQNCFRILELQKFFIAYKWVIMYEEKL